jgi:cytochrome c2
MFRNQLIVRLIASLCLVSAVWSGLSAQDEAAIKEGKSLFKANCATCHAKDMKSKLTGPALGGVEERWADYPRADLHEWVRNSQKMVQSGHPMAAQLWADWKPTVMTPFPNLTDAQIDNILAYINCTYKGDCPGSAPVVVSGSPTAQGATEKPTSIWMYALLLGVLGVLALVLSRIISNLNYINDINDGREPMARKTFWQTLTSKSTIAFVLFALVLLGGYTTVRNAMALGRQQGYQADQPIKFSHATHAGVQKIDCQYCHDGARRSKQSIIPATNTCMNCHAAIKNGSKYGTAEITKIYASIGFDPESGKYVEDYDNMAEADIQKMYKNWIRKNLDDDERYASAGGAEKDNMAENQWEGIVKALKVNKNDKIQGPIEWVRMHNLPDHVFFSHEQHVTAGKVACQSCHGKVEEMEVVQQYAPLSMGWCINCHRESKVQFADNEFYDSYQKFHQEIKEGKRDAVTVEDIGGLECQKCHY